MYPCPLCQSPNCKILHEEKRRPFYLCANCFLVFVPESFQVSLSEEKKRYDTHQNDPQSLQYQGYKKWMSDFWFWVQKENIEGIVCDYGSGPYPIMQEIMKEFGPHHFQLSSYDFFYLPQQAPSPSSLDAILLSEVVEHFRNSKEEWEKVIKCLKPKAKIFIRTSLWSEDINWAGWAYARDFTHVAFYHRKTFDYLARHFNLELVRLEGDKIEMKRVLSEK